MPNCIQTQIETTGRLECAAETAAANLATLAGSPAACAVVTYDCDSLLNAMPR